MSRFSRSLTAMLCAVAALVLSGCSLTVPAVIQPDTEPGSDYYEGYMAGASFADDAWRKAGTAATWLDQHSLTATDVGIHKALLNLPPVIVEDHSAVWVEAFRAGASTRFDQYRSASLETDSRNTGVVIFVGGAAILLAMGIVLIFLPGPH